MVDSSILNPEYKENPEIDYKHCNQYLRNTDMFRRCGKILYPPTRAMYEYIKNVCIDFVKSHPQYPKFIWKPKIVDVGCGGGFGSNILSQEADFVWGIDIDEESIKWAKDVFTRHKNNIYYNSQLTFEVIDVLTEPREIMKFDIVVCIETIEHINEYQKLLNFIKKLCKTNKRGEYLEPLDATLVYISSPNRNSSKILKDHPRSKRHIREWTPEELYAVLTKNFKYVTIMNHKGELKELSMTDEIMLLKCETPI